MENGKKYGDYRNFYMGRNCSIYFSDWAEWRTEWKWSGGRVESKCGRRVGKRVLGSNSPAVGMYMVWSWKLELELKVEGELGIGSLCELTLRAYHIW
jgi:hypothetical protein